MNEERQIRNTYMHCMSGVLRVIRKIKLLREMESDVAELLS